ncbi:MAG: septal ring lytic transglycosylase RlpA family protein, partial [Deltaproteobacteria bacterium]|nr:septal ring lytic transglycosylase RlpA family protein [Deltaproteobacteria bacterium]
MPDEQPVSAARYRQLTAGACLLLILASLWGCARRGPRYDMSLPAKPKLIQEQEGIASWYGRDFHGKKTSSGEIYNMYDLTAAHKELPLGSRVLVTNLENGRQVEVVINDRGPFIRGRIIDLSYGAAKALDMVKQGTALVRLKLLAPPPGWEGKSRNGRYYGVQAGSFVERRNARKLY